MGQYFEWKQKNKGCQHDLFFYLPDLLLIQSANDIFFNIEYLSMYIDQIAIQTTSFRVFKNIFVSTSLKRIYTIIIYWERRKYSKMLKKFSTCKSLSIFNLEPELILLNHSKEFISACKIYWQSQLKQMIIIFCKTVPSAYCKCSTSWSLRRKKLCRGYLMYIPGGQGCHGCS